MYFARNAEHTLIRGFAPRISLKLALALVLAVDTRVDVSCQFKVLLDLSFPDPSTSFYAERWVLCIIGISEVLLL